jgi:hypothetical protein
MTIHTPTKAITIGVFAAAGLLSGCGSDADGSAGTPDAGAVASDPDAAASALASGLEDTQDQVGGGSATLTVGGQSYAFDSVLCAFGSETGNPDFDFSLSAIADGVQLSVDSGPTYGDNVTLNDIENFDSPTVGWGSQGDGFLTIADPDVSGSSDFLDTTDSSGQTVEQGELVATCP